MIISSEETQNNPLVLRKTKDFDLLLPLYISVIISPICLLNHKQATHTTSRKPSFRELADVSVVHCMRTQMRSTYDQYVVHCTAFLTARQASAAN